MQRSLALLDTPGGGALLFEELVATLRVGETLPLAAACAEAERLADAGRHVVAALDYEIGRLLEPRAATGTVKPSPEVLGCFWIFSRKRQLDAEALAAFLAEECGNPPAPAVLADFRPTLAETEYCAAVARIREYIAAGDCYQVNFTFPFTGRCVGDPLALYARLRAAQPVAHGGLIVVPDACILSFSPELFVTREAGRLYSRPMKGSAARGTDTAADVAAAAALRASEKDRAENVMIVDLIRNDLGRIAVPGSVHVEALCTVETYPSIFQMTSTVSASSAAPLADVLAALFPCGSITGAPKVRAMQIIDELEASPRGLYTGALGWVGQGGDFCFSVAIRTLLVEPDRQVRYGVGSGVVWDSEAHAEYRECLLKAAFVHRADPGFRLIETLRLEAGMFPQLAAHLDRLVASAETFAFACDPAAVAASLLALAAVHASGVWRVRLTLGPAGDIETTVVPLDDAGGAMRARISSIRVASSDFWLRHKTTVRAGYDAELKRVMAEPDMFDAIFLNERGEVCEGARSNVFVRMAPGAPLLTPPVACGLLPGVLRRRLLESGLAVEAVLLEDDLRRASELYLGNALRGLIRVVLSP